MKLGAARAQALLAELKAEEKLKHAFQTCGDARLIAYIFFKLFELGFGKASESIELSGKVAGTVKIITTAELPEA